MLANQSIIPKGNDRKIAGRRLVLAGLVITAIGATLAYAAQTQIFDPQTHKWVDYDKTKARKYYAAHKEVPEAFRPQMVKFRTAEVPVRSSSMAISIFSTSCSLVSRQCATASVSAGKGLDGPVSCASAAWRNGQRGHLQPKWSLVIRNAVKYAAGMPGGPDNPLGARALYLYAGDQDTIYRIHGTPEPWTIGLDVSSGCSG